MDKKVKKLEEYMEESPYTVAVTGSGISYLSGMRRFKQQVGRENLTQKLAPDYIRAHPDEVYAAFKDAFLDAIFELGPSPVHYQMVELEKRGLLQGIVTQNLDCLHTLAGSNNVVAFMGDFSDTICIDCGATYHDVNVWNEGKMPTCPACGGYLIPVYFDRFSQGFATDRAEAAHFMEEAQDLIAKADLLLIIGTTGFHSDEYLAKLRPSTKLVQINPSSTVFDRAVVLNIKMDAEKVFDEILEDA